MARVMVPVGLEGVLVVAVEQTAVRHVLNGVVVGGRRGNVPELADGLIVGVYRGVVIVGDGIGGLESRGEILVLGGMACFKVGVALQEVVQGAVRGFLTVPGGVHVVPIIAAELYNVPGVVIAGDHCGRGDHGAAHCIVQGCIALAHGLALGQCGISGENAHVIVVETVKVVVYVIGDKLIEAQVLLVVADLPEVQTVYGGVYVFDSQSSWLAVV